mmetsp:Transcript_24853/g.57742  ORF Transcript_24853/g.57742 Transcript_24853/m.57742 type:complete len:203 (-) Transcript_24853:69-677(-)
MARSARRCAADMSAPCERSPASVKSTRMLGINSAVQRTFVSGSPSRHDPLAFSGFPSVPSSSSGSRSAALPICSYCGLCGCPLPSLSSATAQRQSHVAFRATKHKRTVAATSQKPSQAKGSTPKAKSTVRNTSATLVPRKINVYSADARPSLWLRTPHTGHHADSSTTVTQVLSKRSAKMASSQQWKKVPTSKTMTAIRGCS